MENSYPAAAIVHQLFTTALAVGKKRKKSEEAVAATRSIAQSAKELLPGDMGSAIIDANSEGSSLDSVRVVLRCLLGRAYHLT